MSPCYWSADQTDFVQTDWSPVDESVLGSRQTPIGSSDQRGYERPVELPLLHQMDWAPFPSVVGTPGRHMPAGQAVW